MGDLLHLLKISVIVSCVVVVLVLLKPALSRRYHAKWKYYVWLALAVLLLLPLSPLGLRWSSAVETYAPIQIEIPAVEIPLPGPQPDLATETTEEPEPASATAPAAVIPQQPAEPTVEERAEALPLETILQIVWLAGAAALALYYALGTALFYRRCLRWSAEADSEIAERLQELREEMGIRREIPVLVSDCVTSPMMIGLFRPRLLLPREPYTDRDLDFILRHELTHYRRRDLWYKLALLAANCVHWFNPFAYLLVREASLDMELTCDDAVLEGADGETRRAYSETLLSALHRQKGMPVALSTHFYGGAETMRERFQNILGGSKRKRGLLILCAVLVVTVAAGCIIGFTTDRSSLLTEEEIAVWQERLESPAYNGFLTHMYTDIRYLRLPELLYNGAGITHEPEAGEVAAYLDAIGMETLETDLEAIYAEDLAAYLDEHTGLALSDFVSGLDWVYVEAYDSYYFQHGDTNYVQPKVVSGEQNGATVTLTVAVQDWNADVSAACGAPWGDATLTITDGKIVSYTNDLYASVEAMAWSYIENEAERLETDGVTKITDRYISSLSLYAAVADEEGNTYEAWSLGYRLKPEDMSTITMAGGMSAENGWLTETSSMGSPYFVVRVDAEGRVYQEETGYDGSIGENGYTLTTYLTSRYVYDLTLNAMLNGWPEATTAFIMDLPTTAGAWATTEEGVLTGYLLSYGDTLSDWEVLYEFDDPGSHVQQLNIVEARTADGGRTYTLLMAYYQYESGTGDWAQTSYFWQVVGSKMEGTALPPQRGLRDREVTAMIPVVIEGYVEEVNSYLYQGGGAYGIYTWSLYIPYGGWQRDTSTYRWYPDSSQLSMYLEVRDHGTDYTAEEFYTSYEEQFDEVLTNEGTGADIPWAIGVQESAGGRYTSSILVTGETGCYEVLWTYAAEAAEGWGQRLRYVADTFRLAGESEGYNWGELKSAGGGAADDIAVVTQGTGDPWIEAGTYLVLPSDNAFRLEDYFLPYIQNWMTEQGILSEGQDLTATDVRVGPFTLAHTYDRLTQDQPVLIFSVDWGIGEEDALGWMPIEADGYWEGNRAWLAVEHDGETVIRTAVMLDSGDVPGDATFTSDLEAILNGLNGHTPVMIHTTHPAIFYDRASGQLYAVHTQPAQPAS